MSVLSSREPPPLVGRDDELAAVVDACRTRGGTGAVVLVRAAPGTGKTRLAVEAAAALQGGPAAVARGYGEARGVPFGVVLGLLGPDAPPLAIDPPTIEAALHRHVDRHGIRVIVADDVPWVDPQSLAALITIGITRGVHIVATARAGAPLPRPVADLVASGAVKEIRLGPLSAAAARAFAEYALGGRVDPGAVRAVHEASGGNALAMREVMDAADWRRSGPGWVLERLRARPSVAALLARRLEPLTRRQRAQVEMVALTEPLAVPSADALAAAVAARVVTLTPLPDGVEARLAHPLFLDVLRAQTSPAHWCQASALARTVLMGRARDATGALVDGAALLRGVMLGLDAGEGASREDIVPAARRALDARDGALALRLADVGLAAHPDDAALWEVRACALADEASPDAGAAFLRAAQTAPDDASRARVAIRHAAYLAGAQRDPGAATALLDSVLARTPPGDARDVLAFERLRWVLRHASSYALPASGADAPATAPAVAASRELLLAHVALIQGRLHAIPGHVRTGTRIADEYPVPVPFYAGTLRALDAMGRFFGGELAPARDAALRELRAPGTDARDAIAAWSHLVALTDLYAGRYAEGVRYAQEAVHATMWGDTLALSAATRAVLAAILARSGHAREAARVLRSVDRDAVTDPGVHLSLLEARVVLADRRGEADVDIAQDCHATAQFSIERGAVCAAVMATHLVVRTCPPPAARSVVAFMEQHATGCDGWYLPLLAVHTRARADGDAAGLAACAERFADGGFLPNAREAFAQATEAGGTPDVRSRVRRGAVACGAIRLSTRELEVASLAREGHSSKEIAVRLGLSRRTVENHLARIYRRTGIRRRAELAPLVDAANAVSTTP